MRRRVVWYRILALLGLVLLTSAASLTVFLYHRGIHPKDFLKSVQKLIHPKAPTGLDDPFGNNLISTQDAEYFYVKNRLEGYLLVLTGRVENLYSTPRRQVLIKASLQDEDGQRLIERRVFAGWALSREDLETLSLPRIRAFLERSDLEFTVAPGRTLMFMVVFEHIPRTTARFTIEPVSSLPAKDPSDEPAPSQ